MTVEYDFDDDVDGETIVFRLDGGSEELIKALVEKKFPRISQVNVASIARFADGNARVAINLANSLEQTGSVGALRMV